MPTPREQTLALTLFMVAPAHERVQRVLISINRIDRAARLDQRIERTSKDAVAAADVGPDAARGWGAGPKQGDGFLGFDALHALPR